MFWLLPVLVWVVAFTAVTVLRDGTVGHMPKEPSREKERPPPPRGLEPDSLLFYFGNLDEREGIFTQDGESLALKIFEKLGNEAKDKPWNDAAMKPSVDAGVAVLSEGFFFSSELQQYMDIVDNKRIEKWEEEARKLRQQHLENAHEQLQQSIQKPPSLSLKKVVQSLQSTSTKSPKFMKPLEHFRNESERFKWPVHSQRLSALASMEKQVEEANGIYQNVSALKGQERKFRPVQLVAMYAMAKMANDGERIVAQMKTGEGKTDVCAAIASILARGGRFIAVHIITSGEANAKKDFMATKDYIKAATGHEPILASDGIPWNENDEDWTHARIVYCQITDIMKSLVKAMQNSRLDKIQKYLSRSYALVDEADFVMFEQGSNQLYVSSAVQGYSALMPFLFRAAGLLDYHAEYDPAQIKTQTEVGGKIGYFIDDLKKPLKELEGSIRHDGTWFSSVPSMVDKDGKFVSIAQGALQARLKLSDQDYVVTRKQGGHAEITIVNLANGEEAYGSRWINEGPFAEVQQGLPIQGMEPIAFFASVQLALMTHGGFGGITGTVGNSACLDFLGKHFSISGLYRFPRNTPTMMYWLDAQEATTTEGQHKNIFESVLNFNKGEMTKSGRYGVPKQPSAELKGPVEIVFKTIQECKAFESFLKNNGRGDDFNVIPFYRSSMHSMLEGPVPTNTIIIASNMGGRGLDIKLHKHDVLLVILTQVLDDRQDMQARGRCGRNGKPGVIQYQLLKSTPGSSNEDVTVTLVRSKYFSGVKADQELQSRSPLLQRDMKATKVLESFSTTRMPYIEGWLEKLFAGLSLKDDLEPLVKGFLQQFIISIYDKRWACWKDSSSPRREESHSLPDFRRTYHLSNPVDLGEGRTATDPVEELARRLYALCHVLRLDAAEATELASTLLRIKGEKWLLMLSAKLLLHSSGNESPWPSKFAGHRWQSDWTGKAGLLLAMVSPEYRAEGLRRYSVALKHLAKQLSEIPDLEGLAHNRGKRLQDKVHRDIRPFYPEQLQLAQEQVKHLRQHVDRLVGTGHLQLESLQMSLAKEAFSVDGMSISVKDLRQLMGQKWTEAIFSVRPAGTGWAIPSRKGDFKDWTKHLEMVGQEGQGGDGPDSNARSSGGGGGPNQRMEAQTSEQSQEVETALIEALNENSATDIKGFQDEFQASSVKADFSNMDTGSGYFSTMLSKFKEKVSFLQATSSWCEKMGSYAQEAWSRISEAAKDASWFKAKKSQGEEKKQEVVKEAHRLMQEAVDKYNKEAADVLDREFPPSSRRSEDFDPGRVEANGKKDTRSQAEIELEAKAEEDAAQFYAFDKDASADDRFLQAHALAAIKKDLARQPGGEELAETMDELERLNSALTQKAQEAKLAGKELCSDQEARAIQQAYVNVLRAALEVMKFADETGLSSVSELWDKANTMIWRKNQEGLHRSWIGWIFCPFSRWNYVEARNAFERFEKWGDSPLFNTEKMPGADKLLLFNIQKFRSSGLLMSQRLRRRCALREFTNANWFERWWNPSYRIQLGNSLSAAALDQLSENEIQQILEIQALQDRANTEYLRRWQQTQTELQFVLIGLSILIAIIGFFTGGLALAVLALVAALAQLVLAVLTNNVEDRTDLTREEKQQLSNIYSVVMSVLGLLHLGLSSVCSQVAQKVAEWLTKLVNYMRMLQAAVATPFLMQTVSRLTSSDQLLQQGDGTLWGSLAAVCQLVMDLIGLGNALRPRAVPVEEEGPTRRPGRRPEDGGQDDAERNNDAVEHDTESSGWTLAGALTALGTMLRSLVRERTRTNEASKTEREPKKEELNSAERNQEVRRRDLKADGQIHASVIEEKIELQVQNDNDQGATMYMEEHGQKVLQTENGQFQYAGKKIDPNLQRQILQNKGFKEDEDFHVSNDGIARLMGQSEAVDKHGDTADTADTANSASWNNFVSLLLALEKVPESDRSKFTRLVMEQAFSREKTPTLQEVVSKRISSDSVKADDAGMKVQRSDELELAGDGSSLRLRMTEDEVPSETGSTSIQVDNANLKVSSQGIEPSGTLPKENAKLLFNMLNQDAENFCLDAEAVEEMVNSLPDEVNLEQMAEALHSAEAKAQPSPERQAAERQDENPERAQVSKRDVVESFVAKLRRLMEKSETPESNLEMNAVVKLANKILPGKNLKEELTTELVEGQVHFVPKELKEKNLQFGDKKLSAYRSIMYLLERQKGYDQEQAKQRVENLDKKGLLKQFLSSFLSENSENRADRAPARESAASEPTAVQRLEEKLKDIEIQYGLEEGVESTLQDLVAKSDIAGLDKFVKDFLDKNRGQNLVDAVSDIEPLVGKALEEQGADLRQHVEELKGSIPSGSDALKSAGTQTVLEDMKRYVGSAKVGQKAQGMRWYIQQVYEILRSLGSHATWALERAEEMVMKGVDYREMVNLMENFGFKMDVDYKIEYHQGGYHMYPVATLDSLPTLVEDNFCGQRTLAVCLARRDDPNLSVERLKELASDPAEINRMNKVLAENGVLQEQLDDAFPVGRPDFDSEVRDLMREIADAEKLPKFHICHGLAWKEIEDKIDEWRDSGDDAKFEEFLTGFLKPNSMAKHLKGLASKAEGNEKSKIIATTEKHAEVLQKQQEMIPSFWDKVKREKVDGKPNEKDVKELKKLLNKFVGNLRPGVPKDNMSIGRKNDLTTYQNGYLTDRSQWVDEVNGGSKNYRITEEGVKSSQVGRRFILGKRVASLFYKEAEKAKKRAKDGSARLQQKAKDAVGQLQQKATQAKDKAKDAVGQLQQKAKQAKDKAKDAVGQLQQKATQAKDKAKDALRKVSEHIEKKST